MRSHATVSNDADRADVLSRLLVELRPKLHRYSARMTGSVIDGEDVVQEALAKAVQAVREGTAPDRPEAWLFRIAHNAALDFLRRRARHGERFADEDIEMIGDDRDRIGERLAAAAALGTFMRLPTAQRSTVVLMDVLGYSLDEICAILGCTVAAAKASLHRGRTRLRQLSGEPQDRPLPPIDQSRRSLLARYIDRFNARDFDAVRDMLAEEVRLELVAKSRMAGKAEVGRYFGNYERTPDWLLAPGYVEGRPAILVGDPREPSAGPTYFVLLGWEEDRLVAIRDFRYARYVMEAADVDASA